uniref:Uncharacterized protein n=1 Tax=Rhodopseudomonas palustris (strain BisA53) TaxID=316055 RepID=Q07IV8_RHOP5
MTKQPSGLRAAALLIGLALAPTALAQGASPPAPKSPAAAPQNLTGKERLGEKWKDEQRIDNCRVPADKRGARPRPDSCPHMS